MSGEALLFAEERQLVNKVTGQTEWTIVRGSAPVEASIVRILRQRDFRVRVVEDLRHRVDERAPGEMHTRANATAQSFLNTGLHRVVDRRPGVSTQTNRSSGWICSNCWIPRSRRIVSEAHRIAVDAFEETA